MFTVTTCKSIQNANSQNIQANLSNNSWLTPRSTTTPIWSYWQYVINLQIDLKLSQNWTDSGCKQQFNLDRWQSSRTLYKKVLKWKVTSLTFYTLEFNSSFTSLFNSLIILVINVCLDNISCVNTFIVLFCSLLS